MPRGTGTVRSGCCCHPNASPSPQGVLPNFGSNLIRYELLLAAAAGDAMLSVLYGGESYSLRRVVVENARTGWRTSIPKDIFGASKRKEEQTR